MKVKLLMYFTAIFVTALLCGCGEKSYKKTSNSKLVDFLNAGNPNEVISRVHPETTSTNEKYWLASAYAMRGRVDVMNLYPMLEMYLFNRSAWNWDELDDVKDPYRKFLDRASRSDERSIQEREEAFKEFEPRLRSRFRMEADTPTCEEAQSEYSTSGSFILDRQRYSEILAEYQAALDKAINHPETVDTSSIYFPEYVYIGNSAANRAESNCRFHLSEVFNNRIKFYMARYRFISGRTRPINPQDPTTAEINWENIAMEILWHTYEAVPFLQRIPVVTIENQFDVSQAIRLMLDLKDNTFYRPRALKSILYWASVSILSIYRAGFNFEQASSMKAMYCSYDMGKTLEYYSVIRERLRTLKAVFIEYQKDQLNSPRSMTERERNQQREENEKIENYLEQVGRGLQNSPETLSVFEEAAIVEGFKEKQLENCIISD